jgi:hypothetical protein
MLELQPRKVIYEATKRLPIIMETKRGANKKAAVRKWLKQVGIWGFLFFLVKGLVWLAVGYWVLK